ncbi:hypothetical protein PGTUg99_021990 [Puccinia graminis f. sp. tritici]|uniref:Uncharacterized protein n=1 Tax=Puccinia graminis f. sp. tritici TaxID=56615 RepID=A0A5B0M7K6_PUCGR|nr:hypothetical protein PGTUg99_021990 [Puccinia graminis f. sp. tritici]
MSAESWRLYRRRDSHPSLSSERAANYWAAGMASHLYGLDSPDRASEAIREPKTEPVSGREPVRLVIYPFQPSPP